MNKSFLAALAIVFGCSQKTAVEQLSEWMQQPEGDLQSQVFVQVPMSEEDSEKASDLLLKYYQDQFLSIKGKEWDERVMLYDTLSMPFFYKVWGEEPEGGHSLFISMHGGGSAPKEVNDQQYKNQQHLYDSTMMGLEGVYLAPRAPSDDWNMWHQEHIDTFFKEIISLAELKEGVNPNKVYLLGYSAGGDGVYQLAPRLAPYLAGAAMMAGHPNDASALSMRNVPYALHMGALDDAFRRNELAAEWGVVLDSLQQADPGGYVHDVQIHEGRAHWMYRDDAVALPWMAKYSRRVNPEKVVWYQDDVLQSNFYWLEVPIDEAQAKDQIIATYDASGLITIKTEDYDHVTVYLNDKMIDLDQAVTISLNGKVVFQGIVKRNMATIAHTIDRMLDPERIYTVAIEVDCVAKHGHQQSF